MTFNAHILLVEDYPANILVASTLLESLGYTFEVVENGQDAVDKTNSRKFHAVLMDIEMPVFNGYFATDVIRKHEFSNNLNRIPIIGMTAHASITDRQKCLDSGMDDYISKPFNFNDLESKLSHWTKLELSVSAA